MGFRFSGAERPRLLLKPELLPFLLLPVEGLGDAFGGWFWVWFCFRNSVSGLVLLQGPGEGLGFGKFEV